MTVNKLINLFHILINIFLQDDITWVVPESEALPEWQLLILIFQLYVWLVTTAAVVFIVITIQLSAKKSAKERPKYKRVSDVTFIIISMIVSNSTTNYPKSIRIRIILLIWAFFCLNWGASYTSILIKVLTARFYDNKVNLCRNLSIIECFNY